MGKVFSHCVFNWVGLNLISFAVSLPVMGQQITVDPFATLTLNKVSVNSKVSVESLDTRQVDFLAAWKRLLAPATMSERYQVMDQLCQGFTQEQAVAFAGYIGAENMLAYDHRRSSDKTLGQRQYQNEQISIGEIYETHRNRGGFGSADGRLFIGICGDSTRLVADFLTHCGFTCDDIDVLSYRTSIGGHQLVTAQGQDGTMYSMNWNESLATTGRSALSNPFPNSHLYNLGGNVGVYDCQGKAKGQVSTPLGDLLMRAHGEANEIDRSGHYNELSAQYNDLVGIDEIMIKIFKGQSLEGDLDVSGIGLQVNHSFLKNSRRLVLDVHGSLLFADARTNINYFPYEQTELRSGRINQSVFSPQLRTLLEYWPVRKETFGLGGYADATYTTFLWKANMPDSTAPDTMINRSQGDGMGLMVDTGVKTEIKTSSLEIRASAGVKSDMAYSVAQNGGLVDDLGNIEARKLILKPNHFHTRAEMVFGKKPGPRPFLTFQYDNLYLFDRSQVVAGGGVQGSRSKLEVFYGSLLDGQYGPQNTAGVNAIQPIGKYLDSQFNYQHYFGNVLPARNRFQFGLRLHPN